MDLQLDGHVVIVTGAASGIGEATAAVLAREGAIVVGVDRDPMTEHPSVSTAVVADVTDDSAADRIVETVLEQHGRLDAVVNNAGGLRLRSGFVDITEDEWLDAFQLDFHAARRLSRAAIPVMVRAGHGALVHIASDSARLGAAFNPDYAAAKLALLSLSKSLAAEFTPQGVRSNVVTPGPTRTPLYDRPGGFGSQVATLLDTDIDGAIQQIATALRPVLTGRFGGPRRTSRK